MENYIQLSLKPDWNEIEPIRRESTAFLESHGFSVDTVNALTMIVSELMENAIKYGSFTRSEGQVALTVQVGRRAITVEVSNPIDSSTYQNFQNLRKLDRAIQWIRGYQDPFEAYLDKLKEIAQKPFADKESGLGLVRIAYEGRGIVDFFLDEDGLLNVSVISSFFER
ncbi:MAG: ATP-binding protein [Deltaproteobacteria bacterium]|nr:ATP-binding protein [Deltaproteobacteria bacterium]